jgi:hypothetical protein
MQTNQHYTQLLQNTKSGITKSRYVAARHRKVCHHKL